MARPTLLLVLLAALLSGCAIEPRRAEPPTTTRVIVQPAPPSEVDQLLAYSARLRKLEPRELALEREQARSAVLRDKSDFSRVKLALLLAAATATHTASEDVELIAALEPVVATPAGETAGAELRLLAQVLHVIAIERRKLREQLRESQVRLVAARRDEPREAETRALRAKVEDLEKKLNALKSIDRSVNRRVETPRK